MKPPIGLVGFWKAGSLLSTSTWVMMVATFCLIPRWNSSFCRFCCSR